MKEGKEIKTTRKPVYSIQAMCVECGAPGTKGSLKHPYCEECFSKVWNNDYKAYFHWLGRTHD